jgi:hypothetical protein
LVCIFIAYEFLGLIGGINEHLGQLLTEYNTYPIVRLILILPLPLFQLPLGPPLLLILRAHDQRIINQVLGAQPPNLFRLERAMSRQVLKCTGK